MMRPLICCLLLLLHIGPALAQRPARLEVLKLDAAAPPYPPGTSVTVSVTVRNAGDLPSAGVLCRILGEGGQEWGRLSRNQDLPAGQQTSLSGQITVPEGANTDARLTAQAGPYRQSDLALEGLELPKQVRIHERTRVLATVKNKGQEGVGGFTLELKVDGRIVDETRPLARLEAGQSQVFELGFTPGHKGAHHLEVILDRSGRVTEQDETNNRLTAELEAGAERSSQVSVQGLAVQTVKCRAGSPVRLLIDLDNQGDVEVYKVPVVLRDGEREVLRKDVYGKLVAYGKTQVELRYTPLKAGDHHLTAVVGASTASCELQVLPRAGHILKVVALESPRRVKLGTTYVLTAIVKNVGELAADSPKVGLDVDGHRVTSAFSDKSLASGQEDRVLLRWVPARAGRVHLSAAAESQGAAAEEDGGTVQIEVLVEDPAREQP